MKTEEEIRNYLEERIAWNKEKANNVKDLGRTYALYEGKTIAFEEIYKWVLI